jgi:hypothetical protein
VDNEYNFSINQHASIWAEQLITDSAFTGSDVEELISHLIDLAEELKEKGLDDEEAFTIALARLGDASLLKNEFEEVNTPVIQMRRMILVLSGILIYFLLYFLMLSSSRLLVLILDQIKGNPEQNISIVFYYVAAFHLFMIVSTILLNYWGKKMVNKIVRLKIKPQLAFILFTGLFTLAIVDQWFRLVIKETFEFGNYTYNHLYTIFDYSGYSFPLIMILCFIVLFKKYYRLIDERSTDSGLTEECLSTPHYTNTDHPASLDSYEQLQNPDEGQLDKLIKQGLDEEEARWIVMKRNGLISPQKNDYNTANRAGSPMRIFLLILSGVLVYFFLYFVLFSSARIFFTILQQFENNPLLNTKRTWSYVLIYQTLFIFFTVSLYIKDKNLVDRIKQIHINPVHSLWIFLATVILAIIDRCFYSLSKNSFRTDFEMKTRLYKIFLYSNYSFPFIICTCLLLLFYKYYRDNIMRS